MENWDKVKKQDLRTHVLTNAGHDLRSGRDAGTAHSSQPGTHAGLSVVPEGGEGFGGGAALSGGA